MHSGFACKMQQKAERLAEPFADQIYGVKCWYSSARLFDQTSEQVFVSINPGGNKPHPEQDQIAPYRDSKYNAWLDEDWGQGPGGSKHQKLAVKVFDALYGTCGKSILRDTSCFPVAPFRTPRASKLPPCAWEVAKCWFRQVLAHLAPRVVLCNGNGESRSPWSVLREGFDVEVLPSAPLGANANLKRGEISSGDLRGTKILAIPHLTGARFNTETLFGELDSLAGRY